MGKQDNTQNKQNTQSNTQVSVAKAEAVEAVEDTGVTVTETQSVKEEPAVETKPVVQTTAQQPGKSVNVSRDMEKINTPVSKIDYKLREYMEMMATNRQQSPESMSNGAFKLAEIINDSLRVPGEFYQSNMNNVINVVRANRAGVFHDKYVYRGFLALHARFGSAKAELITEVLSVILTVADSKSIEDARKRVSPAMVAERLTIQEQADMFISYFNRGS